MNQIKDMSKSYKEVYKLLSFLGEEYINKIPEGLYKIIVDNMDDEYDPQVLTKDNLIDEKNISKEAIGLMAIINLDYFVTDKEEKEELKKFYKENETKYNKKYSADNIFKNAANENKEEKEDKEDSITKDIEDKAIAIVEEEKWYKKILNKLINLFKRKSK